MFTKDELNFLLLCVNAMSITNTNESRSKAVMMMKLSDALDAPEEKSEALEKPKPKKK